MEARTQNRGERLPLLGGALLLALMAGLLWSMPTLHIVMVIHDSFVPLDDGWRAVAGQIPHVDHHSPMGPLYDAAAWGAQALGGSDPAALARMNALALLLLSPLLLSAGHRISSRWRGVLWILALALLAVSPRYLGHPPSHAAWMAAYNRWCWSALAAIAILCVLKPKEEPTWRDGLALGWGLVFLGTVKITFALAGGCGLVLCCILAPWLRRPAAIALATAAAAAAILLLFPVGRGYLSDLLWAAGIARGLDREFGPLQILLLDPDGFLSAVLGALAMGIHVWLSRGGKESEGWSGGSIAAWEDWKAAAGTLVWAGAGMLLAMQNGEANNALFFVSGGIFVEIGFRRTAGRISKRRALAGTAAGACALAAVVAAGPALDAECLRRTFLAASDVSGTIVLGFHLEDAYPNPNPSFEAAKNGIEAGAGAKRGIDGRAYLESLEAGADLLRRFARPEESVRTLAFANPFPFLLQRPSPTGGPLWLDSKRTWSPSKPGFDPLAGADLLMIPRYGYDFAQTQRLLEAFGPRIEAEFEPVARTPLWDLNRRRAKAAPSGP